MERIGTSSERVGIGFGRVGWGSERGIWGWGRVENGFRWRKRLACDRFSSLHGYERDARTSGGFL